eukprot:scaffold2501_cov174-Amphora_coffeaeformis.AAC.21
MPATVKVFLPSGKLGIAFVQGSSPPEVSRVNDDSPLKDRVAVGQQVHSLTVPGMLEMSGMITSTELVQTLAKYEGREDRTMVLSSASPSSSFVLSSSSLPPATTANSTPVANVATAMANLSNNNNDSAVVYLFAHEQDHDVVLTYFARQAGTIATRHDIYCKVQPSPLPVPIYGDQTVLLPVVKSQVDSNAFEAMLATPAGWQEITKRRQDKQLDECLCFYCLGDIIMCGLITCCCQTESNESIGHIDFQRYESGMYLWKHKYRQLVETNQYRPKFQVIIPQQQQQPMNMMR